jgi:ADP-ribosylglycohydrolase
LLSREQLLDKIHGGWMGKAIGGTLGAPYECQKDKRALTFYDPVPTGAVSNDDLDLQLMWLHALQVHGIHLTCTDLGEEWLQHMAQCAMWDEYGYGAHNMRRGLRPPLSGAFGNPFGDAMGSPIRSEIWAMVCPAMPPLAAAYAWHDSVVDHGGESIACEGFLAALEAAAFVVDDLDRLIDLGLRQVPPGTVLAGTLNIVRDCRRRGLPWQEARDRVLERYEVFNPSYAPINLAWILVGLLWGEGDFGATICTAVNCGWDTDCTGASAGAIMGILLGADALPDDWVAPIGGDVVVGPYMQNLPTPQTLDELAEATLAVAEEIAADLGVEVATPLGLDSPDQGIDILRRSPVFADDKPLAVMFQNAGQLRVRLELGEHPTVRPEVPRAVRVVAVRGAESLSGAAKLAAPFGWRVEAPSRDISAALDETFHVLPGPDHTVKSINHLYLHLPGGGEVQIPLVGERRFLVAGPFPNESSAAFDDFRGPELDPGSGPWQGRDGEVRWERHYFPTYSFPTEPWFAGRRGILYFLTDFLSPAWGQTCACKAFAPCSNGVKVCINGGLLIDACQDGPVRAAAHYPGKDGYIADCALQAGRNRVLIKLARGDQPVDLSFYFVRGNLSFDEELCDTTFPIVP